MPTERFPQSGVCVRAERAACWAVSGALESPPGATVGMHDMKACASTAG